MRWDGADQGALRVGPAPGRLEAIEGIGGGQGLTEDGEPAANIAGIKAIRLSGNHHVKIFEIVGTSGERPVDDQVLRRADTNLVIGIQRNKQGPRYQIIFVTG